jgi:hypothetical protein
MGPYDKGSTNTLWTQTIAIGLCDKGFANTLWTQTIVMGPYDKGFTNNFWTETLGMGPYDKGFTNTFWTETIVLMSLHSVRGSIVIHIHKEGVIRSHSVCKSLPFGPMTIVSVQKVFVNPLSYGPIPLPCECV